MGESVYDESTEEYGVRDFVLLDGEALEVGEGLEFGNLDETVDVVVLEEEGLQLLESLQFANVAGGGYLVKPDILEANLLHCLLEVLVVQYFQSIPVNEQFLVAFDLSVT